MILLGGEEPELLLGPNKQHDRSDCCRTDREDDKTSLKKENYLSEFKTEYDKSRARSNLGILDDQEFTWANIKGDLSDNEILKQYLENLTSDFQEIVDENTDALKETFRVGFYSVETKEDLPISEDVIEGSLAYVTSEKKYYTYLSNGDEYVWELLHAKDIAYTNKERPLIENVQQALDAMLYNEFTVEMSINPTYYDARYTGADVTYTWTFNKTPNVQLVQFNGIDLEESEITTSDNLTYQCVINNANENTTISLYAEDLFYGSLSDSKPIKEEFTKVAKKYKYFSLSNYSYTGVPTFGMFSNDGSSQFLINTLSEISNIESNYLGFNKFTYYLLPKSDSYPRYMWPVNNSFYVFNDPADNLNYVIYRDERGLKLLKVTYNSTLECEIKRSNQIHNVLIESEDGRIITYYMTTGMTSYDTENSDGILLGTITTSYSDDDEYGFQKLPTLNVQVQDNLNGKTFHTTSETSGDLNNIPVNITFKIKNYGKVYTYLSASDSDWKTSIDGCTYQGKAYSVSDFTKLINLSEPASGKYLYYVLPKGLILDSTLSIKTTMSDYGFNYSSEVTIDNSKYIIYRESNLNTKPTFSEFKLS